MYSMVCHKVHDSRFTLSQIQKSIQRARHILDNERIALAPELVDKLLLEREKNDHKGRDQSNLEGSDDCVAVSVPFMPAQPIEGLQAGNMYLKSVDKNYRRLYDKYNGDGYSPEKKDSVPRLFVRRLESFSTTHTRPSHFSRVNTSNHRTRTVTRTDRSNGVSHIYPFSFASAPNLSRTID